MVTGYQYSLCLHCLHNNSRMHEWYRVLDEYKYL